MMELGNWMCATCSSLSMLGLVFMMPEQDMLLFKSWTGSSAPPLPPARRDQGSCDSGHVCVCVGTAG